tara:strand:+ start:28644 stop:29255 length:612 start_codon:yes stop_codon:yes gene_type:complete
MLFQENKFLQNLFLNKSVLEIGCNQGLTTLQISKFAKKVVAIDNNKNHIYFAKKLRIKKNIKYLQIEMFDKKAMYRLGKFEIIYLREIFNFLKVNDKRKIIKILQKILQVNGKIIITDFYSNVFVRKKILNFIKLNDYKIFSIDKKSKIYHFQNKRDLKIFFDKLNMNLLIFTKDPLTKHIGFLSKIIEYVYPCKYTAIVNRK